MSKPSLPIDKPSRRDVEKLFRELMTTINNERWEADEELREAIDNLEKELMADKRMVKLKKERDKVCESADKIHDTRRKMVAKVRAHYQAEGLTPRVQELLKDLVNIIHKED